MRSLATPRVPRPAPRAALLAAAAHGLPECSAYSQRSTSLLDTVRPQSPRAPRLSVVPPLSLSVLEPRHGSVQRLCHLRPPSTSTGPVSDGGRPDPVQIDCTRQTLRLFRWSEKTATRSGAPRVRTCAVNCKLCPLFVPPLHVYNNTEKVTK